MLSPSIQIFVIGAAIAFIFGTLLRMVVATTEMTPGPIFYETWPKTPVNWALGETSQGGDWDPNRGTTPLCVTCKLSSDLKEKTKREGRITNFICNSSISFTPIGRKALCLRTEPV